MNSITARELFRSEFWKDMSSLEIAQFQLFEDRLCMPFNVFHSALEDVLGRSIWTTEFAVDRDGLKSELLKFIKTEELKK